MSSVLTRVGVFRPPSPKWTYSKVVDANTFLTYTAQLEFAGGQNDYRAKIAKDSRSG